MDKYCLEHSGHASRLYTLEGGQKEIMNTANAAHRRLDGMKNWVIAGMTSLVMQLILVIVGLVFYWVKAKTGS